MKSFTPTASRRLPGVESKRAATAELTGAWVCSSWSSLSIFTSIVFHSCPIFGGFATVQKLRSFLVAWPRTSRPAQFLKHHVCYRRWCGDFGSAVALHCEPPFRATDKNKGETCVSPFQSNPQTWQLALSVCHRICFYSSASA